MTPRVLLTADVSGDLEESYEYIAGRDSMEAASRVLERIEEAIQGLSEHPHRGHHPRELLTLGILEYREIVARPYRIIYRVTDDSVVVYLIADGCRDMLALLARRLLESGR